MRTHEISDLDGDGRAELVEIRNPDSSEISVSLHLSRGPVCGHLAPPSADSPVADVIGSTVLAGRGSEALWIAYGTNGGTEVALAHRDGCTLRYLERSAGDVFHAETSIYGHLCCRDAVASARCIAHAGWIELVTFAAVPSDGAMATGPDSSALPYSWSRERLRLERDLLVSLGKEEGRAARRDALPKRWLNGGLDCLGLHSY